MERLCAQIRTAGAVPVLYATWAYQEGGAKLAAKGWDYETMARTLSEAYRQAARENHALLAEVGEQFRERSRTENLYAADSVHPNALGSRIAAETLASVIQKHKEN